MVLEAAGIRLPDVAEVAEAPGDTLLAEVQRKQLAEAEAVARMGADEVVPYPTTGNLVVRLAELGTEHHAQHRQVGLVAQPHGQTPRLPVPVPQGDAEVIAGSGGKGEVDAEAPLGRIVPVAVVVEEAKVCTDQSAAFQVEVWQRRVVVVPACIVGQTPAPVLGGRCRIVGLREGSLQGALEGDVPAGHTCHPLRLQEEVQLQARVLHRRQIGVELPRPSHAQEQRPGRRAPLRHRHQLPLLGKAHSSHRPQHRSRAQQLRESL